MHVSKMSVVNSFVRYGKRYKIMSKIGNKSIIIPEAVTVTVVGNTVVVKGAKGELKTDLFPNITAKVADGEIQISRKNDEAQTKAFHGLVRSLVNNNIIGVSEGYKKTLKLIGTGYRVKSMGAKVELSIGFSHPVIIEPVEGVKITVEGNDTIHIEGIDKQKIGQLAADIRANKKPEPYKGKGIRYEGEEVKLKPGKAAVS